MSLSSLIVQREIATIRQVEEALARQVLYGGDLVTNVLEVADVPEEVLLPLLAETAHLPQAPVGALPAPSAEAQALVPRELAMRCAIFPLGLAGGRLVVAVAEGLAREVLEELSFALGVQLEQRVAPLVRIREALATHYGAPLERRMQRLLGRLTGTPATGSGSLPPLLRTSPDAVMPTPSRAPPPRRETPRLGSFDGVHRTRTDFPAVESARPSAYRDRPVAPAALLFDPASHEDSRPSVVVQASVVVGPVLGEPDESANAGATSRRAGQVSAIPTPAGGLASASNPAPPLVESAGGLVSSPGGTESPVGERPSEPTSLVRMLQVPSMLPRSGRRRRGPITLDRAKLELEHATERDALLDLFFDFSLQFFEYTALFVAHGDLAEGRDAYGPGATRQQVLGIGVPLDMPSALSAARDRSAPVLAKAKEGLDLVLVEDLERGRNWPILVVPLVVRGRTVALLYGDNGEMGVDGPGSSEVTAFAARVGQAFERIIVRRKLGGFVTDLPTQGPRVDPKRVVSKPSPLGDAQARAAALRKALVGEGALPRSPGVPSRPPEVSPVVSPVVLPESSPPMGSVSVAPEIGEGGDVVWPLSGRRTVRDLVPPFASFWGEPTHRVTREFSERPPPPQVVVVRPLSGPPIPREDPPALALDLTPGPPPVSDWPTIEVGGLEEADEETILGEVGEVGAEAAPVGRAVALPPRSPPSQMHRPDTLPSVIVDVDVEFAPLVERLVANPADERAEAELLRQGQHAMAAIMARFPGPILLSRAGVEEGKARVTEYGPILRVIAGQRRVALPFVLAEANAPDPERRFWGTFLLSELAYPEAVPTIVARLVDAEERTRSVARLAARVVGESARDALVEELDRIVRDPQAANDQRIAILETLGVLRDAAVVPVLLSALSGSGDLVDQAARQALSLVARQDFGFDTRRWLAWWSTNSSRHRVEWLIDALTHEQAGIRKAAAEELGAVTREYFGYYEDLPRRERERAQQRYVEWWRSEGHARFGWG